MPPNRKTKLLEELGHLKQLIEFHIEYKSVLWENREGEFEEHLNGMLDYYNQIRKELEKIKMVTIKNKYLKSKFEQFQKLSTTDKATHLDKSKIEFNAMSEVEKEAARESFKENLVSINNRLQEIEKEINVYKTIEVYPKKEKC
jgi:hypothetical protein